MIIEIAAAVLVTSCLALTAIICAQKWGAIEFYDLHIKGRKIFRQRIGELCIFCFGFWLAFALITAAYFLFQLHELYFVVPFASASLTRSLYETIGAQAR